MDIVFAKILGIFGIVLIGYGASKIGWLPQEAGRFLSKILMNIASPCVVIMAMAEQELTRENLHTMGMVVLVTLIFTIFSILIGLLFLKIFRVPADDQGAYLYSLTFTNNGFIGFPITTAILGAPGLVLMIINNMATLFFAYTLGVKLIAWGKKDKLTFKDSLKQLASVPVASVAVGLFVFFIQWEIPLFIEEAMTNLGNMMVPLSMIIIGIQLAGSSLAGMIKNWRIYALCIFRLIAVPGLVFAILLQFDFSRLFTSVITLWLALPGAAIAVVLAEEHKGNPRMSAELVFVTTLFSMATLPVWAFILYSYTFG